MTFGGTDEPCGLVELESLGVVGGDKNKSLVTIIGNAVQEKLGLTQDRLVHGLAGGIPVSICFSDCLIGLVVKASASGAEGPDFESRLRRDFSGSSHTSDLKIGTPVATLSGAWHYRVSAGTGQPGVSIL